MKKRVTKLVALLLVGVMTLGTGLVSMAAPLETQSEEVLMTEGIEKFFTKNVDGTMSFDANGASLAGYNDLTVEFVNENVENINNAVRNEGAILDDDFKVTIYVNGSRARGQSKVEVWATGMVLVYMNTAEIDDLYRILTINNKAYNLASTVSDLITAKGIIVKACSVSSKIGLLQIYLYKAQINKVKSKGTGIIMYVTPMPDGVGSTATFGAQ